MTDTQTLPTRRSLRQTAGASAPSRGRLGMPVAIAALFLLGVGVLLYPAAASWFTQLHQASQLEDLSSEVTALDPDERQMALDEARAYNATLVGGASVVADERKPLSEPTATGGVYADLLRADPTGLMARIRIPSIALDLPIFHGTADDVLERGVGHLEGTALPVGGTGTHAVLTGHRGLAGAELFTNLDRVVVGDSFTVEVFGEAVTYRVSETKVVQPDETETLNPRLGRDLVTLITCTPLGVNSHRILVTGERVTPTPQSEVDAVGARSDVPGFPWWAVVFAGAAVVLTAWVRFVSRPRRPRGDS